MVAVVGLKDWADDTSSKERYNWALLVFLVVVEGIAVFWSPYI